MIKTFEVYRVLMIFHNMCEHILQFAIHGECLIHSNMTEYLVPGQPNGGLAENCMIGELQVVYSTLLNIRKSKVQYS